MCLAIPGKVIAIDRGNQLHMGTVDFDGISKTVCLELVPDVHEGDYVIVHVGYAISRLNEIEANKTLKLIGEMTHSVERKGSGT